MLRPMDLCRRMGSIPSGLAKGSQSETRREKRRCGLAGAQTSRFCKLSTLSFPRWPYCATLPYTTPLQRVSPWGEAAADPILMASYTLFCPVSSGVFFSRAIASKAASEPRGLSANATVLLPSAIYGNRQKSIFARTAQDQGAQCKAVL